MAITAQNVAVPIGLKTGSPSKRQSWSTFLLGLSQFVTWPFLFIFFYSRYNLRTSGIENLKKVQRPFMIVANHIHPLDSFLFRIALGFRTPHLPLRFMAVRRFAHQWLNFLAEIGFIDFLYGLFGVFTVVPGQGLQKNLLEAKRLVKEGNNIVIYPEGRLNDTGKLFPFKPGAGVLATETGITVVPISFRLSKQDGLLRKELFVNVGEPISNTRSMTADQATDLFFTTLSGLYM